LREKRRETTSPPIRGRGVGLDRAAASLEVRPAVDASVGERERLSAADRSSADAAAEAGRVKDGGVACPHHQVAGDEALTAASAARRRGTGGGGGVVHRRPTSDADTNDVHSVTLYSSFKYRILMCTCKPNARSPLLNQC